MKATLLVKPGCSLCVAMRRTLNEVREAFGLVVEEMDVTEDPALRHMEYAVPLLLLDGVPTFRFTVTPKALHRLLLERGCVPDGRTGPKDP